MITQKKSNIFLTLGVLLITLMVAGNILGGTLKGKVTDQSTGEGLYHAIITVNSDKPGFKTQGTVADETGDYRIENLEAGVYTIKFSYVGFTAFTKVDLSIGDDDEIELSHALIPVAINMNSISVSASRQPEKIVDAPASVSLVSSQEVAERATLTPTEHVKTLPGVDIASTGLAQSNVVVRGFNNIFSGTMLVLTDNRIARVPSLRFNAHNFITTVNDDIERIEVVSGPGSALYGPNAASGVMHIITKSPFNSQGTSVTFGGGERELFLGSFRHAGVLSDNVGYKFTGQYYQGLDWKHHEPIEPDSIALYRPTPNGPDTVSNGLIANNRNFDIEKISGEGRFDFLLSNDAQLIVNGGFNRGSSIELTGLGAGQAIDWSYYFGQARLTYKDLFIQGFVNGSDAGDTYLLNTGQLIVDKSRLWVAQIQHRYQFSPQLEFTYGLDGLFTRPNTESTINGRNENNDNINEIGAYLQGEYKFSEQLKLVGAARLDDHNKLEDMIFSPRAGLVYQPDKNNNFRVTFNEAFSTPDNNNLYLDILSARTQFFDLRVQGVPESGFHWSVNDNGPQFRSQFAPYDPRGIDVNDYINYNDPIFTNVMWGVGYSAVTEQFLNTLQSKGLNQTQLDAIEAALGDLVPSQLMATQNALKTFNPDNLGFDPSSASDIADINRLEPTITRTIEFGYKGIINDRFQVSVDLYRTEKENFIGPLTVETPNVFLDQNSLMTELFTGIETNSNTAGNEMSDATIASLDLDNPDNGGNGNGTYSDELAYIYASGAERIPFGVVSPEEALDPNTVLITYRNFGDVSFYGADLGFSVHLNQNFNVGGSYSYVSKNFFAKNKNQVHDIYLNAPKHKFGLNLNFTHPTRRLDVRTRGRFVDAFKMVSPFEGSEVKSYFVLDFNLGIDIIQNTRLNVTIQNILDNRHAEFVGAPELGRLAIMKITTDF